MMLTRWAQRLFTTAVVTTLIGCTASLPELPIDAPPRLPVEAPAKTVEAPAQAAGNTDGPQTAVAMERGMVVLHKAANNPFDQDTGKSFKALNSLEKYQAELARYSIEATKPVDFTSSQVLVSSIGEKPTGGYEVTASEMEELDDRVVVTVVQSSPGPGCITSQAVTHPFEFVLIPSDKPIEIFERQRVDNC